MNNPIICFPEPDALLTNRAVLSMSFEDQRHFICLLILKSEGVLDLDKDDPIFWDSIEAKFLDMNEYVARRLRLHNLYALAAKRRIMKVGLIDENWQPTELAL